MGPHLTTLDNLHTDWCEECVRGDWAPDWAIDFHDRAHLAEYLIVPPAELAAKTGLGRCALASPVPSR